MTEVEAPSNRNWAETGTFDDEDLGFLCSFEEILQDGGSRLVEAEKQTKNKKKKKKAVVVSAPVEEEKEAEKLTPDATVEDKKKLKKEKRKLAMEANRKKKLERLKRRKLREQEEANVSASGAEVAKPAETKKRKNEKKPEASASKKKKVDGKKPEVDLTEWNKFHFLPKPILDAISDLGFSQPTEIQEAVLPPAARDRLDILGAAETGSGKTLAFAIPVLCRLLEEKEQKEQSDENTDVSTEKNKGPSAVIIAPTRELVIQIMSHVRALTKHTTIKAESIVGGLAQVKQERVIDKIAPEIIVATPGRLWAMLQNAEESTYFGDLTALRCLVIDETDRMVEEGYFDELTHILNLIHEKCNSEKLQTLVFSATLTFTHAKKVADEGKRAKSRVLTPEQKIHRLIKLTGLRENAQKIIDLTKDTALAGKLVEARINCNNLLEKDTSLVYLLARYGGRSLVFVNSVDAARRLYGILQMLNYKPLMLHAKMMQRQRLRNLESFAAAENSVLLATDVAARGLDIKGIDHVIHYQLPKKTEIYIHRSGRTARARTRGLTILLVDPTSRQHYAKLCRGLNRNQNLDLFPIDSAPMMEALRERLTLATEIDSMNFRCKKIRMQENWFEKAARDADLDYDDLRTKEMEGANGEVDGMMNKARQLKAKLDLELKRPLPRVDGTDTLKTKYITPDIVAKLKNQNNDAIDVLHEKLAEVKELKKRAKDANKVIRKQKVELKKEEQRRQKEEEEENEETEEPVDDADGEDEEKVEEDDEQNE